VPLTPAFRPKRVYIVGAGGSGKTTLARQLSGVMHSNPTELDLDPNSDRDALAGREEWTVEGIFLYGIEPLLQRAELIVWLDLPARIAQRRIVVRHFYLSCRRQNRHRGIRRLVAFVRNMRSYYDRPAREPTSATDWEALTRALTERRLAPYMAKVAHLRHPRDVRRFRREFGVTRGRSPTERLRPGRQRRRHR
jgi:MoxR-like ATPase